MAHTINDDRRRSQVDLLLGDRPRRRVVAGLVDPNIGAMHTVEESLTAMRSDGTARSAAAGDPVEAGLAGSYENVRCLS